jgi:hypothetical protein
VFAAYNMAAGVPMCPPDETARIASGNVPPINVVGTTRTAKHTRNRNKANAATFSPVV